MTASPWSRLALVAVGGSAGWLAWWTCARATAASARWWRTNFRGGAVSLALGLAAAVVLVVGLLGYVAAASSWSYPGREDVRRVAVASLLVAAAAGCVGLVDDLVGDPTSKGFRGHLSSLRAGRVSSGLVKLVVIVAVAFVAAVVLSSGDHGLQLVADAGVIAGSANLANLLDLRPGRALKALLVVGLPVALLADPTVGVVAAWPAGVAAGLLPADLGERGMLGDGGANALGGAVGVALAAAGGLAVSAGVLLALVGLTAVSEFVSFSRVIDGCPPLRWADGIGRRR
ncbi:MAG TPA: hypothetical protein VNA14_08725 [Mycobacteriales bacterium]|nr:hypothetical protein [Mycobacteriales bacterium]